MGLWGGGGWGGGGGGGRRRRCLGQGPWRCRRRLAWRGLWRCGLGRARRFWHRRRRRYRDLRRRGGRRGGGSYRRGRWRRRGGRHSNGCALFRRCVEDHVKTLFFNLQRARARGARVQFQKNQAGKQQMREERSQNRPPAQARPLWAWPAYWPPTAGFSGA